MALDQGGAAMRQREQFNLEASVERMVNRVKPKVPGRPLPSGFDYDDKPVESSILVSVLETHDGVKCDCIDHEAQEMTLRVGDTIELNHTCHDGRVDVVKATIMEINVPVEHAKVTVKRGQ